MRSARSIQTGRELFREPGIALRSSEEEDFLPRRPDEIPHDARKDFPEPGTARKDVHVGGEFRVVGERDPGEFPAFDSGRSGRDLPVLASLRKKSLQHGRARQARGQIAGVLFEDRPFDPLEIDLGVPLRRLGGRQLFERQAALSQDRQGRLLVPIVLAPDHPESAGPVIQLSAPAFLVLAPEGERPGHQPHVDAVRPVGRADDPRLAARARPRVARSPGVEQRDLRAAPQKRQGRPAAEGAGSDDDDSRAGRRVRDQTAARPDSARATDAAGRSARSAAARDSRHRHGLQPRPARTPSGPEPRNHQNVVRAVIPKVRGGLVR